MDKENIYVTFEELGLFMCKADTKRKIINPIWDKMNLRSVPIFHRMGYVFRDQKNAKRYYSEDGVKEKILNYLK